MVKLSVNTIIYEVLDQHKNFIETGNRQLSKEDTKEVKDINNQQKEFCDKLDDIKQCFKV